MPRRWIVALLCLIPSFVVGAKGESLRLPPVMEAFYGELVVKAKPVGGAERFAVFGAGRYHPKQGIASLGSKSIVVLRTDDEVSPALATGLLGHFFDRVFALHAKSFQEKRLELEEFVPVDRETFVQLGTRRLLGGSSGDPRFDAWWTVRMGLPQTPDPDHRLLAILLRFDHDGEKQTLGHFCFGLRKKGGDPDGDIAFDFRAPWNEDRPPTLLEGMNYANKLELAGYTANLYDWLYTQTDYRHCMADIWLLPVSREQVALLRWFDEEVGRLPAGQFKGLRKNCASLGMAYLDRLQPISEPVLLGHGLADIPTVTTKRVIDRWSVGESPPVRLENFTHESGREPTTKSEIHRAQPSRARSRAFRRLREAD